MLMIQRPRQRLQTLAVGLMENYFNVKFEVRIYFIGEGAYFTVGKRGNEGSSL